MSSHQYLHLSASQCVEYGLSLFAFYDARQQFHPDVHPLQKLPDGLQMLFSQDFGWSHHAGLESIVECYEHGHQCHECLARSYISLQKSVHLFAAAHVGAYLMHHPLLCSGKTERQVVRIETVEYLSHTVEHISPVFASLVARVP